MLRLLLCVAALSRLTAADPVSLPAEVDISTCRIPYFGKLYDKLYVGSSGGKLSVCFTGPYSPGTKNDCLLATYNGVTKVSWKIETVTINAGSDYHMSLEQLTGSSPCRVVLNLQDSNDHVSTVQFHQQTSEYLRTNRFLTASCFQIQYHLRPFDDQAAVQVKLTESFTLSSLAVDVQVDGDRLQQWSFTQKQFAYYKDMSGCRHSGVFYERSVVGCDSKARVVTCNASAALSISSCGPGGRCQGNGQCVLDAICTVSGSDVIDISGNIGSVLDRCAYTLISDTGFKLLAVFQERRRKDVNFLDHVILHLDEKDVNIQLGPGGGAQVDDSALSLNSSTQLIHGVELSKDHTGVTAKMTLSKYNASIFFDGNTAQIHMTGAGPAPLQGSCVNSSKLSEAKLSEYSSDSCETQYSEPADSQINCTTMAEHCNLLNEAPFTSCHDHIDPNPFITACTNMLCKYPAVDGLQCQFLVAYARACSTYSSNMPEGWKSKASCSPPQGFCQDTVCSAHEFCGEDVCGQPRCLCRANFASKYRSMGVFGEPTVCRRNSASVSLAGCLLAEKGIDYSTLHLNDKTCRGQMDEKTHMVNFGFNSNKDCGTIVLAENQKIIYKNTIRTDINASSGVVSRHGSVQMDISCFYIQPELQNINFKIKGGKAMQQILSGSWNYTLSLKMCADLACTQPLDFSKGVQMDETIYIHVETDGLDGNLISLVTDSCYATDEQSGGDGLKYDLVKDGCGNPQDSTVKVVGNGKGTGTIVSFQMFQFKGSDSGVFLNCKMKLCLKNNPSCVPKCQRGRRRKRSVRPEY
ncbi:alpha-tectorin-like isoform X1 [Thunnus maccoyii]|uniref:alpha-tectorin-like isoform X1 n=1 Tax=Thunnus maccoyii TaxID=8240 RepID=UPI001C4CE74A|nr:alpha-tectorin-like isoform X1 [Thunnus maccoyii]XP_042266312.1 alpha-tectorin-like isoform X1 [Thunnus maccoyii]